MITFVITNTYDMLLTSKDIGAIVHQRLKAKHPLYFKTTKNDDVRRIIDYYGFICYKIIQRGGFLTLSVYKNHKLNRCIRVIPKERNVVYKQLGNIFKAIYHMKRLNRYVHRLYEHRNPS